MQVLQAIADFLQPGPTVALIAALMYALGWGFSKLQQADFGRSIQEPPKGYYQGWTTRMVEPDECEDPATQPQKTQGASAPPIKAPVSHQETVLRG